MCNLSIGWYAQNSIYWILIELIGHIKLMPMKVHLQLTKNI